MDLRRIAAANATLFFLFWTVILLAGADRPPPRGFVWVLLVVAVCSLVVYWRIPDYIRWNRTGMPGRFRRVIQDGVAAGVALAMITALLGGRNNGIVMQPFDYAVWFIVLTMLGLVNSVALYAINAIIVERWANQ